MTDLEKLLCELIALPSVNPAFLPARDPRAPAKAGWPSFLPPPPPRPDWRRSFKRSSPAAPICWPRFVLPQKSRHRLLLAPHLDTVPGNRAKGNTRRCLPPRAFMAAARATPKARSRPCSRPCANWQRAGRARRETEIIFAGLVDEENAQVGSRALAAGGGKADLAIVGEPTRLRIVTAHKGSLWLGFPPAANPLTARRPDLGRNAVHEMAQAVCLLENDYARRLRRRRHPMLGHATVSVGIMTGGTQPNIVPDACRAVVDRRTLPGETEKTVRAEMTALFRSRNLRVKICQQKNGRLPAHGNGSAPAAGAAVFSRRRARETRREWIISATHPCWRAAGIPSVVFGPGDIAQAHTADEWIARRSLASATALLLKFLRSLP